MKLLRDTTGKVKNAPLMDFRVVNILGVVAVVKLDFQQDDGNPVSVQVSVTAQQCRELARQLLYQAEVLDLERPTPPQ